jgi:hypothetical protein
VKETMDKEGPYIFKDLSSQDQMVLIKLQYESKIKELERTVEEQRKEIDRLKNSNLSHGKGKKNI